jgi:PadR family transcriptional regulator PadR
MKRTDALGEFEQSVLLAIVQLDEDAYGVTIRREIEERTARRIAVGAADREAVLGDLQEE